ncbi:hypothetical protein GCM10020254_80950 [Streptomyces goshikiensis]
MAPSEVSAPRASMIRGPQSTPMASIEPKDTPARAAERTTLRLRKQAPRSRKMLERRGGRAALAAVVCARVSGPGDGLRTSRANSTISRTPAAPNPLRSCCQLTWVSCQEMMGWPKAEPSEARHWTRPNIRP